MKNIENMSLSFAGGFADTATFVAAIGIFSSHVTGNFVLFASSLAQDFKSTDILKLLVFPVFIISVGLATVLRDKWKDDKKIIRIIMVLLYLCALASWFVLRSPTTPQQIDFYQVMIVMTVVFSMGFQNALQWMKEKPGASTTVMTGNVAKLTIELSRCIFGSDEVPAEVRKERASELLLVICSFFGGCIISAVCSSHWGLVSLIVPALVLHITTLFKLQ